MIVKWIVHNLLYLVVEVVTNLVDIHVLLERHFVIHSFGDLMERQLFFSCFYSLQAFVVEVTIHDYLSHTQVSVLQEQKSVEYLNFVPFHQISFAGLLGRMIVDKDLFEPFLQKYNEVIHHVVQIAKTLARLWINRNGSWWVRSADLLVYFFEFW